VLLFNVAENDHVVSAARIEESEDEAEADLRTDEEITSPATDPQIEGDTSEDLSDGGEAEGPSE
jgi:DNA gyrase subunit A